MNDLTDDQQTALSLAQAVLNETSSPVAVRHVGSAEDIADVRFLIVLFESKGYLFDRIRGTTQVTDLQIDGSKADRQAAIVESAKLAAHRAGLTVVYLVDR